MPQLAAAVVWWDQPIKCVQEVPLSAAFVPRHARLLSSKTHHDEQGSDKKQIDVSLLILSLAAGALWGGWVLLGSEWFAPKWDIHNLGKRKKHPGKVMSSLAIWKTVTLLSICAALAVSVFLFGVFSDPINPLYHSINIWGEGDVFTAQHCLVAVFCRRVHTIISRFLSCLQKEDQTLC